ncbi:MAG: hypothetical protein ABR964_14905 [Tepidisphaeraceae bacterium]
MADIKGKAGVFQRRSANFCEFPRSARTGFSGAKNQYNQPAKRTYFGIYMPVDGWRQVKTRAEPRGVMSQSGKGMPQCGS